MCVVMYFLNLSMCKCLCLGVIEGLLIILLVKAFLTRTCVGVVFALLGSPDSSKILLHVSHALLSNRFIYCGDTDFKSSSSERGFLLEGFLKYLPLSLHGELFFH